MANAPLPGHRQQLDSFDDSTGPATPYHPEGDSRSDLYAGPQSIEGDMLPRSGFRVRRRYDLKTILFVGGLAYVLGALSAAAVILTLR